MIKKRIVIMIAVLTMLIPMPVLAAPKTVKMKTFNQVIKSGNTVFCSGTGGMYRVSMKGNKAKKAKRIYKIDNAGDYGVVNMRKKGKYLYFVLEGPSYYHSNLYRINTSGKKRIRYTPKGRYAAYGMPISGYAIKGKKIYISGDNEDSYQPMYVINLNGKNRKTTKVRAVMTTKTSNKKGYSVIKKEKNGYYYDYLKTPAGRFYLGKSAIQY